jgi:ABC-2 type transport system permease protein
MMLAVVGPACANLFITLYLPMPSRVEQAVQTRLATAEVSVQGSQQLGQFLQDHPTSSTVGAEGLRQFARIQVDRDREIARRLGQVAEAFDRQRERQRRLADWLGLLSPTMLAQGLLMDAAGTSTEHHDHYRAQVAAYQREWQAFFEPRVLAVTPLAAGDYDALPRLVLEPEPARAMVARSAGRLALVGAAGLALAWRGFRRYRGYPVG